MLIKSLSLLIVFFSLSHAWAAKETVDKIIASVNSEAVLMSDLKKLENRITKPGAIDESLLLDENISTIKTDKKAQLQFLIREKLISAEIKRQNLSITDDKVEAEMNQMAKRGQMSRADFDKFILKQGFSLADYKEVQKNRIERQSFFETEIVSKLRITDEDAYGEYQTKNPNYKPNINEFKIAQIFFDPKKAGGGEAALARATAVMDRLKSGEHFETLANTLNEDGSGNKDGVLGLFKTGEFNGETERAVSSIAVNDYSDIVKSKQGFHIFKLLSKKMTMDPQFLKYKEMIRASLVEKNFSRQLKNWFESKKQDAYIKIYEF
ncbi:MAG: peptidylprolyl isomerase [Pseudobdellovibrio sp.]